MPRALLTSWKYYLLDVASRITTRQFEVSNKSMDTSLSGIGNSLDLPILR